MKNWVHLFPIAVLFITGCSGQETGLPPELTKTSVAASITAEASQPPTRTPPPTATLQATFTPTLTITPTETTTPSPGPSPSPSPIPLESDDPRFGLNLSVPDVTDDFHRRYGWYEYEDPQSASIAYENGKLRAVDHAADSFVWWSTTNLSAGDMYAEVTAEFQECTGKDALGIGFRLGGENYDRGYSLEISCDGHYRMRKFISGEPPEIMRDWTASAAITQGTNAVNRLGILSRQDEFYSFTNGELLNPDPIRDDFYIYGLFGLYANALSTPGLTVFFDDFSLWYLPQ